MEKQNQIVSAVVVLLVLGSAAAFVLPWNRINWGKVSFVPAETVSVVGEAKSVQKNQLASYSAGVDAVSDKKENAVKEVNDKIETLIKTIKEFGIGSDDIKTQSMNIYQQEESYYDSGSQTQRTRKGQWRVGNTIEITLRDITKASDLASLLTSSGANNVYGPNFRMDDTSNVEKTLFEKAMQDARDKAQLVAKASSRTLGKVLTVTEGGSGGNVYPALMGLKGDMGGGGSPIESGTSTVYKSLSVTFELN